MTHQDDVTASFTNGNYYTIHYASNGEFFKASLDTKPFIWLSGYSSSIDPKWFQYKFSSTNCPTGKVSIESKGLPSYFVCADCGCAYDQIVTLGKAYYETPYLVQYSNGWDVHKTCFSIIKSNNNWQIVPNDGNNLGLGNAFIQSWPSVWNKLSDREVVILIAPPLDTYYNNMLYGTNYGWNISRLLLRIRSLELTSNGYVQETCASEGERCQFTGNKIGQYGANGNYVWNEFTDGFNCNVSTFGIDPAYGVNKDCLTIPAEWTTCGVDYTTCVTPNVSNLVKYGVGTTFIYFTTGQTVTCLNSQDPAPGVVKTCWYRRYS